MASVQAITQEILNRVNGEVIETANLVSEHLLTGIFKAMFRVDRATESAEPQIFALSDDPALILDKRMTPAHWKHLPLYVANEEILSKRFQQFMDYEFIFVADITPSMGYRWRDLYLGEPGLSENSDFLGADTLMTGDYSSTKLYILKYLLYAYLMSAMRHGFNTKVMFFSLDDIFTLTGEGPEFPYQAMAQIDEHFLNYNNPNVWEASAWYPSPYEGVFQELLDVRNESVVVVASDFMDLVHGHISEDEIDPYLAELKFQHRLAIMQINDPHEVNTMINRDDRPTSLRWCFQRNVELPSEGGIGQQRYYRPPAKNQLLVDRCRTYLGRDDSIEGLVADMVTSRGITMQKFIYGRTSSGENHLEQRLQEMSSWLEEN